MRISSKNESTHQENKHSFHIKRRVVLLQTTYCFEKVMCCFSSNDVSFTCCGTLGWWEKGEGWCDSCDTCDTCDSKKSKTLLGCARVYTRGKDTYSIFVFDTVLSEPKGGSPLASCKANNTTNLVFLYRFANYVFQNWGNLQQKLHFFVIFALFGAISPHILIGRCFETW